MTNAALIPRLEEAKEGSRAPCPTCRGLGEVWVFPGVAADCWNPDCTDGFVLKAMETESAGDG